MYVPVLYSQVFVNSLQINEDDITMILKMRAGVLLRDANRISTKLGYTVPYQPHQPAVRATMEMSVEGHQPYCILNGAELNFSPVHSKEYEAAQK